MDEEKKRIKVEELRRRVQQAGLKNSDLCGADLVIKRVPEKELFWFKNWAGEEFRGDYGMALKWLCQGYMPPEQTELIAVVEGLVKRIDIIEDKIRNNANKPELVKTGTGKIIKKR